MVCVRVSCSCHLATFLCRMVTLVCYLWARKDIEFLLETFLCYLLGIDFAICVLLEICSLVRGVSLLGTSDFCLLGIYSYLFLFLVLFLLDVHAQRGHVGRGKSLLLHIVLS